MTRETTDDLTSMALELNKLYRLPTEMVKSNIWFNSGNINVHSSQSATKPTALSEMTLGTDGNLTPDVYEIEPPAKYIALTQASGTTTEIILTGIDNVDDLGGIS